MVKDEAEKKAYEAVMAERGKIEQPCDLSQYRVLKRIASNLDNHLAVGFGGGSVPALAANTALMGVFDEIGIRPYVKEVWGTSAGSIVAGAWSCGLSVQEVLLLLENMDRPGAIDIPKWEVFGKGMIQFLLYKTLPNGFVRGDHFRRAIMKSQPVETFEECGIPLRIITCTDDGTTRKVILREGPLERAALASMCIPGVFMPVKDWNGKPYGYFDGAVVEKTPLTSIIEDHSRLGRNEQLVIVTSHFNPRPHKPEGFLQRFLSAIDHMEEMVWEHQRNVARQTPNCKFAVLNPQLRYGGAFDFSYVRFNYLWARKAFKEQLTNAGLAARFDAR